MLDLSVSYNRYKFLGREFLTWLLFGIENDPSMMALSGEFKGTLAVGNRIVFENNRNDRIEQVIIKGEDADLGEGMLALRKGALVSELSVVYTQGEHQWSFQLRGESLAPSRIVPASARCRRNVRRRRRGRFRPDGHAGTSGERHGRALCPVHRASYRKRMDDDGRPCHEGLDQKRKDLIFPTRTDRTFIYHLRMKKFVLIWTDHSSSEG